LEDDGGTEKPNGEVVEVDAASRAPRPSGFVFERHTKMRIVRSERVWDLSRPQIGGPWSDDSLVIVAGNRARCYEERSSSVFR